MISVHLIRLVAEKYKMITDYHTKLYANELLRRCPSDSVEKFTAALLDSEVDINPHQVEAALFAFRSPLSKGSILADEVGLGKTIEAGIILSQKWAERERKILIILPANLRKQWNQELQDKFYLPSQILESSNFNKEIKKGIRNPFDKKEIVLCSYHFARNKAEFIKQINWDLVVIDEAHRLRNVYKTSNKIAREIKSALEHTSKLLLTATPLQNSLLELYGLVSFIDEHAFGDLKSFKSQYSKITSNNTFFELKERLKPLCKRTLRRQVLEYIRFSERKAYTQEFIPFTKEQTLYDMVSEYLQRPNLQALPASQRSLMTLVLRKLLASSTFAIAGSLDVLANKLERKLKKNSKLAKKIEMIEHDFEAFAEIADELDIEEYESSELLTEEQKKIVNAEICELRSFYEYAMQITQNAKGEALLHALETGFKMTTDLGGAEKALIFTESRRTQNYLVKMLSENGYEKDIVLFNGSNNDDKSKDIYKSWKDKYEGSDRVTGFRTVDKRAAIVDYFKETAKIMIATEAAAEGINLQFCSMVVNYDLPWNPQRIEQRIGRCHRYGQKYDVVVINFLNKNNAADQRVFQLLSEKFKLFDGVFGVSDEVLGSIESGVDFEKRIVEIYQTCRTREEINSSFDLLQKELGTEISDNMQSTRQKLLENFDEEVTEKLNIYKAETDASLNRYEALLWDLTKHELEEFATFDNNLTFKLNKTPFADVSSGYYSLKKIKPKENISSVSSVSWLKKSHHYRLNHPLAQHLINEASNRKLDFLELIFDYTGSKKNISILKPFIGMSGFLKINKMTVKALEAEDYIIISALTDDGVILDNDQARRLFNLPATVSYETLKKEQSIADCEPILEKRKSEIIEEISERNSTYFDEEMDKMEKWADDKKKSIEIQLRNLDIEIKQFKAEARKQSKLEKKLQVQRIIKKLEKKRSDMRRHLFEAQDEIDNQKDTLLDEVEARMKQKIEQEELFSIRWRVI